MKLKGILLASLLIAAMATSSGANLIGIFGDLDATLCEKSFPVYVSTSIYVTVLLTTIPAITAAEFRIEGIVPNPAGVIITPTWNSPLTIGDALGDGFSIAFTTPQPGPFVNLGAYSFFVIGDWPGQNIIWCVVETLNSGKLVVVDDLFNEHDVLGWCFVANCVPGGPYGDCDCFSIPTEESSWGAVKALY